MNIVKISPASNGAHEFQSYHGIIHEGWAVVACDTPNFPFGIPTVEEINGVMTVTAWEAGEMPEPEPIEDEPTAEEDTAAMLVDHEYRLTMLELFSDGMYE